jgi:membrane-associated protein
VNVVANLSYLGLVLLVGAESAGLPVPGETSLIVAAVLASQGRLSLPLVIVAAAAAAILGDNVGYLLGRRGGHWLLTAAGPWRETRARARERGEAFFARHGPKAVFFGRWLPWLRVFSAWLAGTSRMPWRRFMLWNALGGVAWAASVGTAAYLAGAGGARVIAAAGMALTVAIGALLAALALRHLRGPRAWARRAARVLSRGLEACAAWGRARPRAILAAGALLGAAGLVVGVSRLVVDAHWLSEVLSG